MKVSKRSLILISVSIFLVAGLILSSTRYRQVGERVIVLILNPFRYRQLEERNELNEKLTFTQSRVKAIQLEPLATRQAELEQQLNQATVQLDTVEAIISQPINKTATIDVLFTTAKAYNLEITGMSLSGLSDTRLEKIPASAVLLTVTVEGDMLNLVGFITKLNTLFTSGAVESAVITNTAADSGKKPWADVKLTLYTAQSR